MRRFGTLLMAVWTLAAPAGAQDFDSAVRELFGEDPARYRAVVEGFQAAVRESDADAAAALVRYPIEVEIAGRRQVVRDPASFAAEFADIVTPEIASAIVDQPLSQMMLNYQGVMLGQGEIWVSGVCLDAACGTTEVKVVAIQPAVAARPRVIGEIKAFHDWRVGCDNRLGCTAIGLPPEGGSDSYVVVRQEAGAMAQPSVSVVQMAPDGALSTVQVTVTGREGFGPADWPADAAGGWVRATAPDDALPGFIRALRDGDRLEVGSSDAEPATVSLRGATAAMLLIDDRQMRIGTVTALARPGDDPAAVVAPPPEPVAVTALPMQPLATLPTVPEAVGASASADPSCEGVETLAIDLGDAVMLWGACDFAAAYNTSFRFWVSRPEGLETAVFDLPGRSRSDPAVLTGPAVTDDGLALEAVNLGRGLGDCGESSRWAWNGTGFALTRHAAFDTCAGVSPDDWPVLWRAD